LIYDNNNGKHMITINKTAGPRAAPASCSMEEWK